MALPLSVSETSFLLTFQYRSHCDTETSTYAYLELTCAVVFTLSLGDSPTSYKNDIGIRHPRASIHTLARWTYAERPGIESAHRCAEWRNTIKSSHPAGYVNRQQDSDGARSN